MESAKNSKERIVELKKSNKRKYEENNVDAETQTKYKSKRYTVDSKKIPLLFLPSLSPYNCYHHSVK